MASTHSDREVARLLEGPALVSRFARGLRRALKIAPASWRNCLRTFEVSDGARFADELFRRSFGHPAPGEPRHFVLVYVPPHDADDDAAVVVGYSHHRALDEVYLGGGMCVDERIYRRFPKRLFREVKDEGGLATIIARDSIGMLGDSPACFGHVGEPRARQADLRTGFVDTGRPHLMAFWRKPLSDAEKERLIAKVEAYGPF